MDRMKLYCNQIAQGIGLRRFIRSNSISDVSITENEVTKKIAERKANFYVRWLTSYPRFAFACTLLSHTFFVFLSVILVLSDYDLFPVNFESLPLELNNEPWEKRDFAWRHRNEYEYRVDRKLPSHKFSTWDRASTKEGLLLFYHAPSSNILNKERLQMIHTIESRLLSQPEFMHYCQRLHRLVCRSPISIIRFFDGSLMSVDPVFYDMNFDNIEKVLFAASVHNSTKSLLHFMLGKDNVVTSSYVSSTLIRTLLPFGWPLPGYRSKKEMEKALVRFMSTNFKPFLEEYMRTPVFEFLYLNNKLMMHDAAQQAKYDMILAVGSWLFVFIFIMLHTRSLWITCFVQFSIICSFLEANFIYRVVLGYTYFGFFHVLAMFIILGIGADDFFVLWNAWQASGLRHHPNLVHRLQDAYESSVISMFVTSLTTMVAFLANVLSPLLATSSFGVFAALLVGIQYLSVITLLPAAIVVFHKYFEKKEHSFRILFECIKQANNYCRHVNKSNVENLQNKNNNSCTNSSLQSNRCRRFFTFLFSKVNFFFRCQKNILIFSRRLKILFNGLKTVVKDKAKLCLPLNYFNRDKKTLNHFHKLHDIKLEENDSSRCINENKDVSDIEVIDMSPNILSSKLPEKQNRLVPFFRDTYFNFVTHKIIRWPIIIVLLCVIIAFTYLATTIESENQQIRLFTNDHHYSRALKLNNEEFWPSDFDKTVTVILAWGLREADLTNCQFSAAGCKVQPRFDPYFDASTHAAQAAFVRDPRVGNKDINMPWDYAQTRALMMSLSKHYDVTAFNSFFSRYLDIPITYWIWDAFKQTNTADYQTFNSLIGEKKDTFSTRIISAPSITTGNRIQYIGVAINTTLKLPSLGYREGIPIVERWERFMNEMLDRMPPEMKGGFQLTRTAWHWLYVQKALVDNAVLGIVMGVSLAFPVLVLATCNIINGLLATLTICCITACVIGIVPVGGWKLGVLVSLNMCLVVGLAVDFVVHLAEGYHLADGNSRKVKLKSALEKMGTSVFSGACTTLGASAFMLFAKMQFFFQFGIFMFCTIGFSLVLSMGLYVTVMGIIGPENDTGDIKILFSKVRDSVIRLSTSCKTANIRKKNSRILPELQNDDFQKNTK